MQGTAPSSLLLHYFSNTLPHYLVSNDQTLIVIYVFKNRVFEKERNSEPPVSSFILAFAFWIAPNMSPFVHYSTIIPAYPTTWS